jgi:hypothetical protein
VGDFVRADGRWRFGAALLLLSIAGIVWVNWGGLSAGSFTAVGMLAVLVGAYRAHGRIAQGRDEPRSRPEPDNGRFTIKAAAPYAGIPSGVNSLIIPDVGVVNWSHTPIELRFTLLAADGSGPLESVITSSRTVAAGTVTLPNPMHLDPRSSRNGRLIWVHGGGDVTPYVAAGVVLNVLEERSGLRVDIPLSTAGFAHPTPKRG